MDLGQNDYLLIGGVIAVVAFGLWAGPPEQRTVAVADDGVTTVDMNAMRTTIADMERDPLAPTEQRVVRYVRASEAVARDLFRALADRHGDAVLSRLAGAEASHADAAGILLDTYGLDDPVGPGRGNVSDPELASVHGTRLAQGRESLRGALRAGAAVQELAISEFRLRLDATDNTDVRFVVETLLRGARNHLRLLDAEMDRRNVSYTPAYLNASAYRSIVDAPVER